VASDEDLPVKVKPDRSRRLRAHQAPKLPRCHFLCEPQLLMLSALSAQLVREAQSRKSVMPELQYNGFPARRRDDYRCRCISQAAHTHR
jgi:hypothetical protein